MSYVLWEIESRGFHLEAIKNWLGEASQDSCLLLSGINDEQLTILNSLTESLQIPREIYVSATGRRAIRMLSGQADRFLSRQSQEHRELLKILQEALIYIAGSDRDLASKLSARAYVHLKTDPIGQRRYDGLLHRFTGVLHRRSDSTPLDVISGHHDTESE